MDWINGFEREIKRTMCPLGVLRQWSFLNVHLKSAKNFKSPPTAKSTGRGIWKLNRIYIARRSAVSSGSLEESQEDGISRLDPIKVPQLAICTRTLFAETKRKVEEVEKMRKLCKPFSLGPIVTNPDEFASFGLVPLFTELSALFARINWVLWRKCNNYRQRDSGRERKDTVRPSFDCEEDRRKYILDDVQYMALHLVVQRPEENALAKVPRIENLVGLSHEVG